MPIAVPLTKAGVGEDHERVGRPKLDLTQFGVDALACPMDCDDGALEPAAELGFLQCGADERR